MVPPSCLMLMMDLIYTGFALALHTINLVFCGECVHTPIVGRGGGLQSFDDAASALVIIAQITLSDRAHDPLHAALQGEPRAAPAVWTLFVATAAACSLLLLGVLVAAVFVAYRAAGRQGTRSVRAVQGRVHLATVQLPQPHFRHPTAGHHGRMVSCGAGSISRTLVLRRCD